MTTTEQPQRLDDEVHDRDITEFAATITSISRPSPSLLRFTAHLPGSVANGQWMLPNVAIRFYLDERYGGHTRVYTVRDYDPVSEAVVVDVVQHEGDSPMMRWSREVQVGDVLSITGPRPHFIVPEAHGREAVLFADETAIPALASIMDQWPAETRGRGWVSGPDPAAFAELPEIAGLDLTFVDTRHAANTAPLAEAARAIQDVDVDDIVVWAAGERDEMREIRRHFRAHHGLDKDDLAVFGYWKRGVTNTRIDIERKAHYERMVAAGADVTDFDDLALPI